MMFFIAELSTSLRVLKHQFQKKYQIKSRKWAETFIGIQVDQSNFPTSLEIHQQAHIEQTVSKYRLTEAKNEKTPMKIEEREVGQSSLLVDKRLYQGLVGILNYFANGSRPDICFAVNWLSRRNSNPTKAHLKQAKRCLKYLHCTSHYRLRIEQLRLPIRVTVYVDSSWGNGLDRRSICGYAVFINTNLIQGVVLYTDNQGSLKMLQNRVSTARSKHIDIKLQCMKRAVLEGLIKAQYIESENNVADIFTKPLEFVKFKRAVEHLLLATE